MKARSIRAGSNPARSRGAIYGISRDGSKNFNLRTWEHMILGQLRIGARSTTYAALRFIYWLHRGKYVYIYWNMFWAQLNMAIWALWAKSGVEWLSGWIPLRLLWLLETCCAKKHPLERNLCGFNPILPTRDVIYLYARVMQVSGNTKNR